MARLILESLARSSDLKKVGRFLKSLNNLDCYLADTDGSHVRGANRARSSEDSDLFLSTGANGVSISADKFPPVPKSVLEDAHIREDIVTYNWSEGGAVTVLPIIRDSLIGYVYLVRHKHVEVDTMQMGVILDYVKDIIDKNISNNYVWLRNLNNSKATAQECVLARVLEFIAKNFSNNELSLRGVCAKNNISYFYLSHLFRKYLKLSFTHYVTKFRINMAKKLLKDQSLTVQQVSYSCGFEDPGYFTKVFKKWQGATPQTYRNRFVVKKDRVGH